MKTQLDEAKIRRLVRESITRRMLSEASGDEDGYAIDPVAVGQSLLSMFQGQNPNAPNASAPSEPPPDTFASGRKRGQSAAEGIASLVGGTADIDPKTRSPYVGPTLGESVKTFIEEMEYINAPFKVSDATNVMAEWNSSYSSVPDLTEIGPDGKPTAKELKSVEGEEGLLRYLIALKGAETGLKLTVTMLTAGEKDYQKTLQPIVANFIELINGYTSIEDLESIAHQTAEIVKADRTPNLFRSKVLLAGFSCENSTTYELLKPIGGLAVLALAAVAVYSTRGLALAAFPAASAAAFGVAAPSGIAVFAGWTALTLAGAAVGLWGVSESFVATIDAFSGKAYFEAVNAVNSPGGRDFLSELAGEVSETYFPIDRNAEYRREQIAKALREITSANPNKSQILSDLSGN